MERIIVKIDRKAKVTLEVDGVKGTACTDLTKSLENALGKTTSSVPTGEMYEEQQVERAQVNQGM
jgi:hypothetical protein